VGADIWHCRLRSEILFCPEKQYRIFVVSLRITSRPPRDYLSFVQRDDLETGGRRLDLHPPARHRREARSIRRFQTGSELNRLAASALSTAALSYSSAVVASILPTRQSRGRRAAGIDRTTGGLLPPDCSA
jgi:hypothetical protein